MKNCILIFVGFAWTQPVWSQENPRRSSYSREISMDVDNDIFFFVDYYYTAGQDLNYRRLVNPKRSLYRTFKGRHADSAKVIVSWSAGFKIFTPFVIDSESTKAMDRPYAGWSYGQFAITSFPTAASANKYQAEIGIVGRNSRMGQLQRWVHRATDFEVPKGWASQIRNELVINFFFSHAADIKIARKLDLVSQSSAQAGTGSNKISQDFTFRTLRFNAINNSAFTQSRLSWDKPQSATHKEAFFFFGAGADVVASNIFIQGSLFSSRASVFTVPMRTVVLRETAGFMFSSKSITWNITTIHLSSEVKKGKDHIYASLGMAVRF